ncbi:MAG TPA: glycosyltransferase [Bryobacteraceae bacterium]|nr:glycosyltransferase [Bryobacteraceae bacterium]
MPSPPLVSVTVVTHNSGRVVGPCLESVFRQQGVRVEVIVVDNASADDTPDLLARYRGRLRLLRNTRNLGFAAAQNQAIAQAAGEWVLTLNPDVLLLPRFLDHLVAAARLDPSAGSACGKLLAIGPGFQPLEEPLLDSTGIYFTPSLRHFDRGWHEPDDGRFDHREYVFGASAAAALYRRAMIADVSDGADFFDPDFFAYREDADLAWRAQLLGWRCLYVPEAAAYHVRRVVPGNRRAVPAVLNMHSVKNRFLMRIKNMTPGVYRRCWLPATLRDCVVVGGCLLWEQTSLAAFWRVARCLPAALEKRRRIMQRRRVPDAAIAPWFAAETPLPPGVGSGLPSRDREGAVETAG